MILLQLEAVAAIMRRQPSEALHFAKESRRLLEAQTDGCQFDPECLAQAEWVTSICCRLTGDLQDAMSAARKVVQLGKDHGRSELHAVGELLMAVALLESADGIKLHQLRVLQGRDLNEAHESADRAWKLSGGRLQLYTAALQKLCLILAFKGQQQEVEALVKKELKSPKCRGCRSSEAGAVTALVTAVLATRDARDARVAEALARLRTLGKDGERAQMEVAFLAANSCLRQLGGLGHILF